MKICSASVISVGKLNVHSPSPSAAEQLSGNSAGQLSEKRKLYGTSYPVQSKPKFSDRLEVCLSQKWVSVSAGKAEAFRMVACPPA